LGSKERAFPAPRPILRSTDEHPFFDLVLVADLGSNPATFRRTQTLVQQALRQGKHVGLFHWPDYAVQPLADTAQAWYDMALHGLITLLVPQEEVQAKTLVFLNPDILRFRIDAMPKVRFGRCLTLTLDEAPGKLLGLAPAPVDMGTSPPVSPSAE